MIGQVTARIAKTAFTFTPKSYMIVSLAMDSDGK
jgi:hypothetical protein